MNTRVGKIGRLPKAIRETLNRKLDDGAAGSPLLQWLNGLPEVQEVIREQFDGQPVSEQNLSTWRQGGFVDWQRREEARALAKDLLEENDDLDDERDERWMSDRFATMLALTLARLLREVMSGEAGPNREKSVLRIARELSRLRRDDHATQRVKMEQERHELELVNLETEVKKRLVSHNLSMEALRQLDGNLHAESTTANAKAKARQRPRKRTQPPRQRPSVPRSDFPIPTSTAQSDSSQIKASTKPESGPSNPASPILPSSAPTP